ncbi:uroplakin-2 [Bombina bombina]|uniref:uroplakin-2 n=1 Tax=Bombina bombina TaxID=8345 RepID=UPI00235ADE78|nr:uroplakin-2 [Bombina bombina]
MHVLGFITALLLISTTSAVDTFNTTKADGLVINPLTSTVIIAFPPCTYDGKTAELIVKNSSSTILTETFIVPQCRLRRDIIIPSDSISGNQLSRNVGYRIRNLSPGGNYTAEYNIKDSTNNLVATGAAVQFVPLNLQTVPDKMARSGGMVVITVLLSVAMFLLLIGLVITLVLGGRK